MHSQSSRHQELNTLLVSKTSGKQRLILQAKVHCHVPLRLAKSIRWQIHMIFRYLWPSPCERQPESQGHHNELLSAHVLSEAGHAAQPAVPGPSGAAPAAE